MKKRRLSLSLSARGKSCWKTTEIRDAKLEEWENYRRERANFCTKVTHNIHKKTFNLSSKEIVRDEVEDEEEDPSFWNNSRCHSCYYLLCVQHFSPYLTPFIDSTACTDRQTDGGTQKGINGDCKGLR